MCKRKTGHTLKRTMLTGKHTQCTIHWITILTWLVVAITSVSAAVDVDDGFCTSVTEKECEAIAKTRNVPLIGIKNPKLSRFPHGCYYKKTNNRIYYNSFKSLKACSWKRICICKNDAATVTATTTQIPSTVTVHPCDRDHGCQQQCIKDNSAEKFHCECRSPEYKLAANMKNCIEVHPCDRDHGCQQQCIKDNSAEKFHCECRSPEYKLAANRKNCIEVHPCDRDHGCQQQCIKDDSAEKFHCECRSPEYKLAANRKNCIEVHPCDRDHGCQETCVKDYSAKKFHCGCKKADYILDTNGKDCIEAPYLIKKTGKCASVSKETCNSVQKGWDIVDANDPNYPPGCFISTRWGSSIVFFNSDKSSRKECSSNLACVCKKASYIIKKTGTCASVSEETCKLVPDTMKRGKFFTDDSGRKPPGCVIMPQYKWVFYNKYKSSSKECSSDITCVCKKDSATITPTSNQIPSTVTESYLKKKTGTCATRIVSKETCKAALKGEMYMDVNDPMYPPGCFIMDAGNGIRAAMFNPAKSSRTECSSIYICVCKKV